MIVAIDGAAIASDDFAARVSIASSAETFARIARSDERYQAVAAASRQDGGLTALGALASDLANQDFDPQYENPNDVALGAILLVVDEIAPWRLSEFTTRAMSARNLWWAIRVAKLLISERPIAEPAGSVTVSARGLLTAGTPVGYAVSDVLPPKYVLRGGATVTSLPKADADHPTLPTLPVLEYVAAAG
jgi:hypothetical protein